MTTLSLLFQGTHGLRPKVSSRVCSSSSNNGSYREILASEGELAPAIATPNSRFTPFIDDAGLTLRWGYFRLRSAPGPLPRWTQVFLRLAILRGMLTPFPLESVQPFVALMKKIIVAVGSTRKPKLRAVMKALDAFAPKLVPDGDFEVVGVDVQSGVSPTPTSCEELMRGARQRVQALVETARETRKTWRYFVGLEGGLEVLQDDRSRRVFLESWAYVSDGIVGFYGRSGGIELPEELAHEVLERGFDLSDAVDRYAGAVGIRDGQGAWGVLSGDLIQRDESFRVAVITAFAPLYNAKMYGRAVRTAV
jgi:inosine/xanthosine triphosphatase